MTREFLKTLGIEDKTVIDNIMEEFQSTPSCEGDRKMSQFVSFLKR